MNRARATEEGYIDFLIATPALYSAVEASLVSPAAAAGLPAPCHDAFTRLLTRLEPSPDALWDQVRSLLLSADGGTLVIDDSVLDKPFARRMNLVQRLWSGRHNRVVLGIGLLTLLWTDGDCRWPCDYRLADPAAAGVTKNHLFREMLRTAHARGIRPKRVAFDCWYSGVDNLKAVRALGWTFVTQVRSNRSVNPDGKGNRPISECDISAEGTVVHLKGFGMVKAFRIVTTNGHAEHWITNDLEMNAGERRKVSEAGWQIEEYHRGLKQTCGVDKCQARSHRAQKNHVGMSIRAFVRLEWHRVLTGGGYVLSKFRIIRDAVRAYLERPHFRLPQPATA